MQNYDGIRSCSPFCIRLIVDATVEKLRHVVLLQFSRSYFLIKDKNNDYLAEITDETLRSCIARDNFLHALDAYR